VVTNVGCGKSSGEVDLQLFLFGRLQAGRAQPFTEMRAGLGLACPPQDLLARDTMREPFGSSRRRLASMARHSSKLVRLSETTLLLLHQVLHSKRESGTQPSVRAVAKDGVQ
jgi:hypothetical protein